MGFIGWIVLGLIAGAIAKAVLKDRAPGGLLATLVVGVIGAAIGGWLGSMIFGGETMDKFFSIETWALAIGGSLIVLLVYGALAGRGAKRWFLALWCLRASPMVRIHARGFGPLAPLAWGTTPAPRRESDPPLGDA